MTLQQVFERILKTQLQTMRTCVEIEIRLRTVEIALVDAVPHSAERLAAEAEAQRDLHRRDLESLELLIAEAQEADSHLVQ
jgi:hypothetical protein